MRKQVVIRLFVDVPEDLTRRNGVRDEETAARQYVADLLRRLPAGMLADYEVLRVEKALPNKALWSE
jgi:hypothetical protein